MTTEIVITWIFLICFSIGLIYLMWKAWDGEGEPKRKDLCYFIETENGNAYFVEDMADEI